MPTFHLAMGVERNFDDIERRAAEGQGPRYGAPVLARRLEAKLYQANRDAGPVSPVDRLKSKLIGTPQSWSFARDISARVGRDDVIYCFDEIVGVPVAASLRRSKDRPKLAVFMVNMDRPRGRLAAKLFKIVDTIDLFCSCCSTQFDLFRDKFKVSDDRFFLLREHLDNRFFTPGPPTPGKTRPLVVAVGLEKRDYRTLAAATHDLNVDVQVAGWSANASKNAKTFPDEIPANMTSKAFKPAELVQLYRDADVTVVSMYPNRYAGITAIMEAMACSRPVVVTRTEGLVDYLTPSDGLSIVEPGDPAAMRQAIVQLLEHPDRAQAQARQGYESTDRRYGFDQWVETIASRLESL